MNALKKLQTAQTKNRSMICLGLDLDPSKMPGDFGNSIRGMFEFATRMIDATSDCVCAYKPNLAFYENLGPEGLSLLKQIVLRIPDNIPVILDAKRGDIGNTAAQYAEMLFDKLGGDWVTLNPYMGYDSMRPFIERKDVGVCVLCLTSNPGHKDFQILLVDGKPLYKVVAEKIAYWNKEDNFGLVVGATVPDQIREIREIAGEMPLLIPGVGAQGGSLEKAVTYGTNDFSSTALINVSRSVLYASNNTDFCERARQEVQRMNRIVDTLRPDSPDSQAGVVQVDAPPTAVSVAETPPANDPPIADPPVESVSPPDNSPSPEQPQPADTPPTEQTPPTDQKEPESIPLPEQPQPADTPQTEQTPSTDQKEPESIPPPEQPKSDPDHQSIS